MLLATPALAEDGDVWRVYPVEGRGGSLAALAASEVDSPEPYWRFAMTCIAGERWRATVSGVDAAALGGAIAAGADVQVSVIADGDPNKVPLSGYFPEITFGQMYGEWEYSIALRPDHARRSGRGGVARRHAAPASISRFPPTGRREAFAAFKALCAALPPPGG